MHTTDRGEAERLGRTLLRDLAAGDHTTPAAPLTLGVLWRRFRTECRAFKDNKKRGQDEAGICAEFLLAYFGEGCEVHDLTADDQAAYTAARRAGGIVRQGKEPSEPVRARAADADLVLLHQMLRWATVRVNGARLLDTNPLAGVPREREENPLRPMATVERYEATLAKVHELQAAAADESSARQRWIKLELALVLAEATGRRLGSIRQLRWDDIEWEHRTIRWRFDTDKRGHESVVAAPEALIDTLWQFKGKLSAVGGWCFPAERNPDLPIRADLLKQWLRKVEKKAELPKLRGGLWHPYRRMWATARKHLPIVDVAAAGGWRDTDTMLRCYQQPTNDAMLAVMSGGRPVHDAAIVRETGNQRVTGLTEARPPNAISQHGAVS